MLFPFFRGQSARLTPVVLLTLAVLTAVGPIATDFYLPAFPQLVDALSTDDYHVQLTLTAFMTGMALGQLFLGPFSDRYGRWLPLIVGIVLAILSGTVAALTDNIWVFIAMRFVQGLSCSAGAVLARAIARDLSSGVEAAKIFSILMLITGIAPVAAPIFGSLMVGSVGWRGIMLTIVLFSLIMLLLTVSFLPESLPREKRETHVLGAYKNVIPLMKNRVFLGYTGVLVATFGVLFGFISASSFVMQEVYGLSPVGYAVVFAVNSAGLMAASFVNTRIVGRVDPMRVIKVALIIQALATVSLLSLALAGALTQPLLQIFVFLSSCTMTPIAANATALALSSISEGIGMASALMGALQFLVAGVVTVLVGLGGEVSVIPMVLTMFGFSMLAVLSYMVVRQKPAV